MAYTQDHKVKYVKSSNIYLQEILKYVLPMIYVFLLSSKYISVNYSRSFASSNLHKYGTQNLTKEGGEKPQILLTNIV